ncbi:site-2 protease family protein [Candidatus Uhrbacteria bacterium]|nr:site-2 protease family protein [Candidatus Uhrbacteria bacterium]
MDIISTIILFLVILSFLVLAHECGHFFAARFFGVHVEEFGLGFPPRIKAWKRGPVAYSLNWLPLGGFVKLKGEQGEAAHDSDSFAAKPIWQRIIILVAGVAMNALLAVVLLTIGFTFGMPQVVDTDEERAGSVGVQYIQIVNVLPDSPAEKSGIRLGDIITRINGERYQKIADVQRAIAEHRGVPMTVELARGDEAMTIAVTPDSTGVGEPGRIGIGLAKTAVVSYPIHQAFILAIKTTGALIVGIAAMLLNALTRLAFDGFVGPVGIAAYTATAAKLGFSYLINLMAQLSVSLAVINVLPIPALDGGRVLFALVEKVRGRALRPIFENAIHVIGFFALILLLLAVTVRDIGRLIPF